MNRQESEALDILESILDVADRKNTGPMYSDDPPRSGLCRIPEDDAAILRQYISARRAAPENKPLTLEQLRQMDGKPVWVEYRAPIKVGKPWGARSEWMLVCDEIMHGNKSCVPFSRIGIDAQAYARRPEDAKEGSDKS